MVTAFSTVTWDEALRGFFLHKKAVRAAKTARWYKTYATSLVDWANSQGLTLDSFTKRHLDEYLVYRSDSRQVEDVVPLLKVDGKVTVRVPDLEWCCRHWLSHQNTGWDMDVIFGNQNHTGEFHKTGFNEAILLS